MPTTVDEDEQQILLDKLLQERDLLGEAILQLEALLEDQVPKKKSARSITNKSSSRRKSKDLAAAGRTHASPTTRRASR